MEVLNGIRKAFEVLIIYGISFTTGVVVILFSAMMYAFAFTAGLSLFFVALIISFIKFCYSPKKFLKELRGPDADAFSKTTEDDN